MAHALRPPHGGITIHGVVGIFGDTGGGGGRGGGGEGRIKDAPHSMQDRGRLIPVLGLRDANESSFPSFPFCLTHTHKHARTRGLYLGYSFGDFRLPRACHERTTSTKEAVAAAAAAAATGCPKMGRKKKKRGKRTI